MSRPFTPKIVTANDLILGDVIYLSPDDTWSRHIGEAELIDDEAHAQLRLLHALQQPDVIGPYLADAVASADTNTNAGGPRPAHIREEFRAKGPSNRVHGKQEVDRNV